MWLAAWPGTGTPYLGVHSLLIAPPPSLSSLKWPPTIGSGNVVASPGHAHWETVEWIISATSPTHPTHVSHTQRSAACRRATQNAMAALLWTGAPHQDMHPPHYRQQPRRTDAWQQGGIAALQPHPRHFQQTQGSYHTPFQASQQPIAIMREQHDHHDHHYHHHQDWAHHSSTVADMLTSTCFHQGVALHCIPWITHEVRGNVTKVAVGPRTHLVCIK